MPCKQLFVLDQTHAWLSFGNADYLTLLVSILLTPAWSTGRSLSATLVHYLSNTIPPPFSLSLCLIDLCLYFSLYFCLRPFLSLCLRLSLCVSLSSPHSLRVSRCPFLVLARSLGSLHALTLAFACACALDLALGLARAFSVCVYFQHSLCLLSRACFLSLSCSFPLVLSRCLWPSLVWISGSDFRDGVRAHA